MSSPFRRTLPGSPSLAQQKKQAKELLQAFAAGDPEARDRVRALLPDKPRIALGDHGAERTRMILDEQPVADVLATPVDG